MTEPLLEVKDLQINFKMRNGTLKIINQLDIAFEAGSFLGLVGESGSGKSVFANSLLGYVKPPGVIESGSIVYADRDILKMSEEELIDDLRGKEIGLIAANARAHLNPMLTVGQQLSNAYAAQHRANAKTCKEKAIEMLKQVRMNDPEQRYKAYPHELSGGMAQRVMIAMTLINSPNLMIADDCTNGLDVTVAAQIMDLFLHIMETNRSSGILITHDLGVVAQCCTHVAIMYGGQIIEKAPVSEFFTHYAHPYSEILMKSLPGRTKQDPAAPTRTAKPDPLHLPEGCLFYQRCRYRTEECRLRRPPTIEIKEGHQVKCFYPLKGGPNPIEASAESKGSV